MNSFRTCILSLFTATLFAAQSVLAQTPAPAAQPTAAAPAKPTVAVPGLPSGMCPLDTNQDTDRAAIAEMHLATQGDSKLLGLYAECTQLNALRAGSSKVTFLSQYATLIEQQGATVALNRGSTLLALSTTIGLTSAFSSQATQAARSADTTAAKHRQSFHQILKQTGDFLIVGSEQRHVAQGKEFDVAVVSLITIIHGEVVTANFFAPAADDSTFVALASQAEAYGNQLLAINP